MHTVEYKKRFHLYSTTQVRKYPSELQVNLLCCHGVKSVAVVLWTLQKIVTKCSSGWRVNKDELKVLGWPKSLDSSIYVSKTQNEIFGQPNSCMTSEIHNLALRMCTKLLKPLPGAFNLMLLLLLAFRSNLNLHLGN